MAVLFYNIFLLLYQLGIRAAAPFNTKAKLWVRGRKKIFERLRARFASKPRVIWVHCASLGEFEQGRPLIEALRPAYPNHQILLTFFSPSGYENRKNYSGADHVFYLPADGPANARLFLEIVRPELAIFVKYEFWYYYLKKIKYRRIPLLLVSALFRPDMSFFSWYGGLQRKMLTRFDHLFVQNEQSRELLVNLGLARQVSVSGDTRFDRVAQIAAGAEPITRLEPFTRQSRVIVAGSTWAADEQLLKELLEKTGDRYKLIIAPHEVDEKHIQQLQKLFPDAASCSGVIQGGERVLIIDSIGLLSRLYQYAYVSYIGGGFGKGIHNTLEAAVYGRPVFFGPIFHKFQEAKDLVSLGAAFSIRNADTMFDQLGIFEKEELAWRSSGGQAGNYVSGNQGATKKILNYIAQENLLFTNLSK